jgi:hypothetical protein
MAFPIAARFAHPGDGYEADQKLAAEHLEPGKVYVVAGIDVGRSGSRLFLDIPDGPQFGFNTVMFDPASVFDEDDGGGRDLQAEQGHAEFTGWAEAPGQAACIAWNSHYAEEHGIEARNEWAASDPRGRAAWEAAANAVLDHRITEPKAAPELAAAMRETRVIRERVTAVAEGLESRAEVNRPSKVSEICAGVAASLRRAVA